MGRKKTASQNGRDRKQAKVKPKGDASGPWMGLIKSPISKNARDSNHGSTERKANGRDWMKRKKGLAAIIGLMVLGVCLITGLPDNSRAMDPVPVRLGTLAPTGSSFHTALVEMGQEWRNASGGAVKLT